MPSDGLVPRRARRELLTVPSISESLAGRAGIVGLWPYTQGEAE